MNITQIVTVTLGKLKKYIDDKISSIKSVQADWDVTNANNKAYIDNKPTSIIADGGNATTINNIGIAYVPDSYYNNLTSYENKIYILEESESSGDEDSGSSGGGTSLGTNLLDLYATHSCNVTFSIGDNNTSLSFNTPGNSYFVRYKLTGLDPNATYVFRCNTTNQNMSNVIVTSVVDNATTYHYADTAPVNLELKDFSTYDITFHGAESILIGYSDIIFYKK